MPTRNDIRTALQTIIEGIDGVTEVYIGRRRSIPAHKLPAACIYMEREEKEEETVGTELYARRITVATEIHVRANNAEAAELLLDQYCADRESAVLADDTLGGLVERIELESDEYEVEEDAAYTAGVAVCRDVAVYYA